MKDFKDYLQDSKDSSEFISITTNYGKEYINCKIYDMGYNCVVVEYKQSKIMIRISHIVSLDVSKVLI